APDPDPFALLEARPGGAPRRALLPRGPRRARRRHRRPVAPDERRARRVQQREMGPEVPRPDRRRPEEAHPDASRRLHQARRHRGGRGDHVARDARRAVAAGEEGPPELLPADDDGHGGGQTPRDGREGEERQALAARRMNPQLKGVEKLEGTYVFDLKTSAKALRLNRFLHGLTVPEKRAAFKENLDAVFEKARLTPEERRMVREL